MLAVKRECATAARAILDFGVDLTVILRKDADGSTPGPLYCSPKHEHGHRLASSPVRSHRTTYSVGQTPLDIANLKDIPRVTVPVGKAGSPPQPQANIDHQLHLLKNAAPFDVERQKVEIPKLRATLDALLADGRLVRDSKLATELLAFAGHLEGKLAIDMARESAAGMEMRSEEVTEQRVL
jgi:hypothetical protein